MWQAEIERAISTALETAQLPGWPSANVRFWQLDFSIDGVVFDKAVSTVATAIAENRPLPPRPSVAILMTVLRSQLAGVRSNKLWPEVAAYFNRELTVGRSANEYGKRFRDLLYPLFGSRIEKIEKHHRYVMLLLEETGIGHDRSRIILEFLVHVAELEIAELLDTRDITGILYAELESFTSSHRDRADVEALGVVLLQAGRTLSRIRERLYQYSDPWETRLWHWEDLRDYWYKQSGERLDALIPEAQEVFEALIPHFSKTVSCEKLFSLCQQGHYEIDFVGLSQQGFIPGTVNDVPLASATIKGTTARTEVATTDTLGLTCKFTAEYFPDTWHQKGRSGYFIWRETPFNVVVDQVRREPARKVFDCKSGKLTGYVWSNHVAPSQTVCAEDPHNYLTRGISIHPHYRWQYETKGPVLLILGIGIFGHSGMSNARIVLAGKEMWQGEVPEGQQFVRLSSSMDHVCLDANEALSGARLELYDARVVIVAHEIKLPSLPFSVLHRNVFAAGQRLAAADSLEGMLLIGSVDSGEPVVNMGLIQRCDDVVVPAGTRAYRVACDADGRVATEVTWEENCWSILSDEPCLQHRGPRRVSVGAASFLSTGNLYPVLETQSEPIDLLLGNLSAQHRYALQIEAAGFKWVMSLEPSTATVTSDEVFTAAPRSAISSLVGLVRVHLLQDGVPVSTPVFLYLLSGTAEPVLGRYGSAPRLQFLKQGAGRQVITGDSPLLDDGQMVDATLMFPDEADLEGGSGITATWEARCRDLLVEGQEGVFSDEDLGIADLVNGKVRIIGPVDGWSLDLDVSVSDVCSKIPAVEVEKGGGSLYTLFSHVFDETGRELGSKIRVIAKDQGQAAHSWSFDMSAASINLQAKEAERARVLGIAVHAEWIGLPSREVQIRVCGEKSSLDHLAILPVTSVEDGVVLSGDIFVNVPELLLLPGGASLTLDILFQEDGTVRRAEKVVLQSEGNGLEPEEIKDQIRTLLKDQSGSESSSLQVVLLLEQYLALHGIYPFDVNRVEAGLAALLSRTERGGELIALFKTRRELLENSSVPHSRPVASDNPTLLALLGNTLLLHVLVREYNEGTLDPESVEVMRSALSYQIEHLEETRLRNWVACLKKVSAVIVGFDEVCSPENVKHSLENPLFMLGAEVLDILSSVTQ